MGIKTSTLEKIKAAPISAVIEATGAHLKRIGHEFATLCLWHEDTNPSLTISDQKGFCFCHCCRAHEDAIGYIQKKKGMSFPDAVDFAAAVLGIQVEKDNVDPEAERKRRAERVKAIQRLEHVQEEFKLNIRSPKAGRIRSLLQARNISPEAAREFGLGFDNRFNITKEEYNHLSSKKGGVFGGRITIPIYNYRNELVGWTGRSSKKDQQPKYKNSPESDLFTKKSLVFNEYRGMEAAREAGSIIFVEGHLDVVSMWQAGIRNVVAMQGTAAPEPFVLERLARSVKNFVLCYDGDDGGKKAALQFISAAGAMASKGKININIAKLPEDKDPDEIIRSGDDLYAYIASAPSWLDWIIDHWVAELDPDNNSMIIAVEEQLKSLINSLQSKALRTHYIDKASRALSKTAKEAGQIAKQWERGRIENFTSSWAPREPHEIRTAVERRMLRLYVHRPDLRDQLRPLLNKVEGPAARWLVKRLMELEEVSTIDLTPHSVMALVVVAEPHYLNQLRTLVRPNVIVDTSHGVIEHISQIMTAEPLLCDILEEETLPEPF